MLLDSRDTIISDGTVIQIMAVNPDATAKEIWPIDPGLIHRISSGQGILDLAGAVKELVENSLDCGANRVDICLTEYGADLIEVADNGPGISPEFYQALTLKYYTSKIFKFADLKRLCSFGFRGEALSSLCALSRVTITTRTADETIGRRLEYDLSGIIVSQTWIARCVGTTVSVSRLFYPLPVRYNELRRNVKREYGKLVTALQAYALISKRVRLLCTNQAGKAGRTTVIQTHGSLSMRDNIISVFGTKTINCLEWIDLSVGGGCRVEGFLSRPSAGTGRGSRDRQFFFINGRPVDMPKAAKALNELYRSFNLHQFPIAVINFSLPTTAYDINVSPDKRKVFVHGEGDLLKDFIATLRKECAPFMHTTTGKKMVEPTCGKAAVQSNEDGGEATEADGGNSCGDLGKGGDFEIEEAPTGVPSDTAELRSQQRNVPDNGIVSKLKPFRPNVTFNSFRRNSPKSILSTASLSAGLSRPTIAAAQTHSTVQAKLTRLVSRSKRPLEDSEECNGTQSTASPSVGLSRPSFSETQPGTSVHAKLTGLVSRSEWRFEDAEECDGILSTASLSAGPASIIPSETQPLSTVQARLSGLVFRFKRPLEQSGEWPRLKKCGLTNAPLAEHVSKVQQLIQPNEGKQGNLSKWFAGSNDSSENDVHQREMSSKLESRLKGTGGLRSNVQGRMAKARYFSSASQDEFSSSSLRRTEQVMDTQAMESSTNNETQGEVSKVDQVETQKQKRKPFVPGSGLNQISSVLPFNRLVAHEVREAVPRPKNPTVLEFDMERLQMLSKEGFLRHEEKERIEELAKKRSFTCATVDDNCIGKTAAEKKVVVEAATKELEQNFNKADFKHMQVVCQFDLRFILARLDEDLFILDQHAADEIYHFELMMKTTVLNSQLLSEPVPLELDAADEKTVKKNKKTFRKNGFEFLKNRKAPRGHKLRLSGVPSWTRGMLGVEDVKELISLLASPSPKGCKCEAGHVGQRCSCQSSSGVPRPSRVMEILTSQACKSSRKVGDALSLKEMQEVVYHLADLESPWTCPHGRPTIRHMVDLSNFLPTYSFSSSHVI